MSIILSIAVLGSLGVIAGGVLAFSFNRLKVEEEAGVEEILKALPGINCGACGLASCHAYARLVARDEAEADLCAPGGKETARRIMSIKGESDAGEEDVDLKAVVRCRGREIKYPASYRGAKNCGAASLSGGGMGCRFGCLGYGDCLQACPFGAITIGSAGTARVIPSKCTGCGLCIKACPRNIIEMKPYPEKKSFYVGCSNRQSGKYTSKLCSAGCIGCGLCVRRAPKDSFKLEDNLARVERQDKSIDLKKIKCPTGCIYLSSEKVKG